MAEATFFEQKRMRPGAAFTVILLHGAALSALLLAKTEILDHPPEPPIIIDSIPVLPPPPPPPVPTAEPPLVQPHILDAFVPPIPPRSNSAALDERPILPPDLGARPGGGETAGIPEVPRRPEPLPRPEPVRLPAQMIGGNLQPPYPFAEQRNEREGRVVIRVTIGSDGRVVDTARVQATSDAFYDATARHARERWRFRPATVDGRPVETTRTLTVVFELNG
jgi:protein TonB